jgi:hypothetical protein
LFSLSFNELLLQAFSLLLLHWQSTSWTAGNGKPLS